MKKFLALLLAMVTVLAMCSSASAAQITLRQYPMPAQVVKTVQLTDTCGLKQSKPSVLYVRHYLWSDVEGYYGSNNHTNYFQAFPYDSADTRYGGNWMTPGTANYVRSNSIHVSTSAKSYYYGVAGRANTKYADAGISTVRVSGYMDSNN